MKIVVLLIFRVLLLGDQPSDADLEPAKAAVAASSVSFDAHGKSWLLSVESSINDDHGGTTPSNSRRVRSHLADETRY